MIGGNYMHTNEELADLIFPDIHETVEDLEKRYSPRNLPEGALVTRFAPSPTGFLHTGSLFFDCLLCRSYDTWCLFLPFGGYRPET